LKRRPAYWTYSDEDGDRLYYFAPENRSNGPYTTQREVTAIIYIADDGTLAGIELVSDMPPAPTNK